MTTEFVDFVDRPLAQEPEPREPDPTPEPEPEPAEDIRG
jgi:hypothetical protein